MAQTLPVHGAAQRRNVVARHEAHAFQHRVEVLAVLGLAGQGERAHGASVEGVVQRHHDALPGPAVGVAGSAHQLERAFDGLGAAVGEERAVQAGLGAQLLGQQPLVLVVVEVGNVNDLRRLLADDLHDAWMRMTQRIDAQTGEQSRDSACPRRRTRTRPCRARWPADSAHRCSADTSVRGRQFPDKKTR